ncbi:MAG: ABC transporter ATP-binding protein [Kineosporiaceae bacterium]|nr:ABC transporter ATP-binding protein [Kineosporiaceae bacterium]
MQVQVRGARIAIDGTVIVDGADLTAAPGEIVGLIGPNGSGKSTLLRGMYRALRPVAGSIHLGEEDIWQLPARRSALRTAVVAQEAPAEFDFTVREVVALGRTPHKRLFDVEDDTDREIVEESMRRTGVQALAERVFATLSGGEKQKVLLSKALA